MTDDGVGAFAHESAIRGNKTEGPAEGEEGRHTSGQAHQLKDQAEADPPLRMGSLRSEQDASERSTKSKEPVAPPMAHGARRTPNQVRHNDPHLLCEEGNTQRTMRLQVGLERGLGEDGGAGGADEIHRDPDQPFSPRAIRRHSSVPPGGRARQ